MSGEQQDGAAGRIEALLKREPGIFSRQEEADFRAVLAERDAFAARLAELEAEREADTRAVAESLRTQVPGSWHDEWLTAQTALAERFADGIAALGERDERHVCGNCEGIAPDSCVNFRAEEAARDEREASDR